MNKITTPSNVVQIDEARKAKSKMTEQEKRERAKRNLLAAAKKLKW